MQLLSDHPEARIVCSSNLAVWHQHYCPLMSPTIVRWVTVTFYKVYGSSILHFQWFWRPLKIRQLLRLPPFKTLVHVQDCDPEKDGVVSLLPVRRYVECGDTMNPRILWLNWGCSLITQDFAYPHSSLKALKRCFRMCKQITNIPRGPPQHF